MLRTSTRVSSGFILARHSSPSFGSQHVCSWYLPTARALGHSGQSRIARRNRAERAREGAEAPPQNHPGHAARQTRAQAEPMRSTTDSRDSVAWQVPGLRPPAYRRPRSDHRARRAAHGTSGAKRRKGSHSARRLRAPLWYGAAATASAGRGSAPARRRNPEPFTFIAPLGLVRPMTRTHVRLLGPCFKTGRVGHRPFARRERKGGLRRPSATRPSQGSQDTGGFPLRRHREAHDVGVPVRPGLRRPQQRVAATYSTRGNTPAGASSSAGTPKSSWVASANPTPGRHEPTS